VEARSEVHNAFTREGQMTVRRTAKALVLAVLSCVAAMAFAGAMFGIFEEREEGILLAGPFAAFGSLAFLVAAVLCCIPVLTILTLTNRLPRPTLSAALGAFLAMPTAYAVVSWVFRDGEPWIDTMMHALRQPHLEMLAVWVLPFAVPGAVLGALWPRGLVVRLPSNPTP
jgi:hypothetical protein